MTSGNFDGFCKSPSASELKHQRMYKMGTPPWKESYRKRCKDQLAKNRQNLLDKLRNCASEVEISASVQEILTTEWKDECKQYEEFEENIEDILTMFEEINAELASEEHEILSQYKHCQDLDDNDFNASVMDNFNPNNIICPLCQKNLLTVHFGVVHCPCGVRIDTEQDAMTLDMIQANLTHATEEHASLCNDRPLFNIFQQQTISNLLMSCKSCDYLYIII